jgi:hypothetical protein
MCKPQHGYSGLTKAVCGHLHVALSVRQVVSAPRIDKVNRSHWLFLDFGCYDNVKIRG